MQRTVCNSHAEVATCRLPYSVCLTLYKVPLRVFVEGLAVVETILDVDHDSGRIQSFIVFLFFSSLLPSRTRHSRLGNSAKRVINVSQPGSSKDKSRWTTFGVLVETCGLCLIDVER